MTSDGVFHLESRPPLTKDLEGETSTCGEARAFLLT